MKNKMNKYKCSKCRRIFKRKDERCWINSYCTATDKQARLIKLKNKP